MPVRAGVRRAPRTIEVATCSMPKNIGKGGALTIELKLVKDVLSHVFGDVYEQVDFQCCRSQRWTAPTVDSANGAVEVNVRLAAECGLKVGYQSTPAACPASSTCAATHRGKAPSAPTEGVR